MSARPSNEIEKKEIQVTFGQVFSGVSSPCNHEGMMMNWETMKVRYLPEPPKVQTIALNEAKTWHALSEGTVKRVGAEQLCWLNTT